MVNASTPTARLIIALLENAQEPLSATQIQKMAGSNRSTTYQTLASLVKAGIVRTLTEMGTGIFYCIPRVIVPPQKVRQKRIYNHLLGGPREWSEERTSTYMSAALHIDLDTLENDLSDMRFHGAIRMKIPEGEMKPFYSIGPEIPVVRAFKCLKQRAHIQSDEFLAWGAHYSFDRLSAAEQLRADAKFVMDNIYRIECCGLTTDDYPDDYPWVDAQGFGMGNLWASDLEIALMTGIPIQRVQSAISELTDGKITKEPGMERRRLGIGMRHGVRVYRRVLLHHVRETKNQDTGIDVIRDYDDHVYCDLEPKASASEVVL